MTRDIGAFTYVSQPHSAPRLNSQTLPARGALPLTIMSDPRVVRGNTHSLARKISKAREEEETNLKTQTTKYRDTELKQSHLTNSASDLPAYSMPTYQFGVKPFAAKGVDISQYLVDEKEETYITKQRDVDTQADEFTPLPEPPPFVPTKSGVDKCTQVEDTNDLFHFDTEVQPMLEVIVKKTMEQALMEVEAEYELMSLQLAIQQYQSEQEEEENWIRLEEETVRNEYCRMREEIEEKTRKKEEEKQFKSSIAGVQMMKQLLPSMINDITEQNLKEHVWHEPERQFIEKEVLPELVKNVKKFQSSRVAAETIIDDMLLNAQQVYEDKPPYSRSRRNRKLQINIAITGSGSEEGEESASATIKNSVVIDMIIHEDDSVKAIQSAFVALITAINTKQSLTIPTNLSLLPRFQKAIDEVRIKQSLPLINMAEDGAILNFPLEKDLVFEFKI